MNREISCRQCAGQRTQIEELQEEVRQLRELLVGPEWLAPRSWRLAPQEATIVRLLITHPVVTPVLYAASRSREYGGDFLTNLLNVYVCKLRPKLRKRGVEIETIWARGYSISATNRSRLRAMNAVTQEVIHDRETS